MILILHVRRGDYLNLQHVHPVQTDEYYTKCLNWIFEKINNNNNNNNNNNTYIIIIRNNANSFICAPSKWFGHYGPTFDLNDLVPESAERFIY